jgi:hypothetical protein
LSSRTLGFVGQCHTIGYEGVPAELAFPEVCKRAIESARPATNVVVQLEPYYHPSELVRRVRAVLRHQPHVVVIEAVGWLAVAGTRALDLSKLPPKVRTRYERVTHFREVSRSIANEIPQGAGLIYRTPTDASLLRPIVRRHPRPSVQEYEDCLDAAIAAAAGTRVVVQGPGAPNLALGQRGLPPDTLERYRAVNEMARRVATRRQALYIDRWDTVSSGFYTEGSVRPSASAHAVWGHLLAAELMRHSVV